MPSSSASYTVDLLTSGSSAGSEAAQSLVRRYVDVTTRDYVIEAGVIKRDRGISSKVVVALGMQRGSCALLPTLGSRLHLVQRADSAGVRQAEFYASEALQHLADEMPDLDVVASLDQTRRGAILLAINYTLDGKTQTIPYTSSVGR